LQTAGLSLVHVARGKQISHRLLSGLSDHVDDGATLRFEIFVSVLRFCQPMKDRDRATVISRLRISLATSPGLCAPANRSRRFPAALAVLASISEVRCR
jgi:hypothetical protein